MTTGKQGAHPRVTRQWSGDPRSEVSQVSLAGCHGWSQRVTDGPSLWATALAVLHGHRCGLSQREGVPRTLPTDGPSWGHRPQRMLAAAQGRLEGKVEMVSQPSSPFLATGSCPRGCRKALFRNEGCTRIHFPFSGKLTVPETTPPGKWAFRGRVWILRPVRGGSIICLYTPWCLAQSKPSTRAC